MTPLISFLRDSTGWQRALSGAGAGSPEQLAALVSALAAKLERQAGGGSCADEPRDASPAEIPGAISGRAAACAQLGRALAELVERRALEVSAAELAVIREWERSELLACVDALAREQEAKAAREAILRTLFASAGIALVELDTQLRFSWVYDQKEGPKFDGGSVLGHSLFEVSDPNAIAELAAHLKQVLDTGVGLRTEARVMGKNEPARDLLLAIEPTRDAAGAVVGVIGASTDITELKKTQAALANALGFREQMMAVLAHDLRNPLSAVRGLSALYTRKAGVPEDVKVALSHIERAGKRMDELIGTLLDFSAARFSGAIPMSRGAADLSEITRPVLDELRQAMPDRQIQLDALGDTRGVFDPARMAQVVANLASNALTHGHRAKPVRVQIDGREQALVLSVHNSGAPIPAALLPTLFEPFVRGPANPERPRGLGLGLYIARQIAVAHGGTLEVASSEAQGTVFTLSLPRESRDAARG